MNRTTTHILLCLGCILVFAVFLLFMKFISYQIMEPFETVATSASIKPTANRKDSLRNYYCKASYNSCAKGDYTRDYVDLESLKNVIKIGCRFLDFEIYDVESEPVVAVSNTKSFAEKGSYNSLPLHEVFATIKNDALIYPEPLILNFRIKCSHEPVMNKIAKMLSDSFGNKLVNNKYIYNAPNNIGYLSLETLMYKVIVAADMSNRTIERSKLREYVNLGAGTAYNRMMTFTELTQSPPPDLATFTKKCIVTCVPDLASSPSNYDTKKIFGLGVQFVAMSYQKSDTNLVDYEKRFDGYSFILKPENLRYYPTVVPVAPALPASQQYSNIVGTVTAGGNTLATMLPGSS